jgi:O-antigen/teichoic acid export membrane protein
MLVRRSALNFLANVFSAVFGLLNVVVFTRWFAPADYGVYVIGAGFATVVSTLLSTWLRLPIMREQAREDGTDIRAYVVLGFLISCMVAPATFVFGRAVGLSPLSAITSVLFALAISYYELLQELLRARLQTFTMMKATMIRAILLPSLGVGSSLLGESGILLLASSALAYLLAALVFTKDVWRGVTFTFDRARFLALALNGIPLTVALTLFTVSTMIDRFAVSYWVGPAQSGEYSAGVDLIRQTLIIPAISLAGIFFPLAVRILANRGADAVRKHLEECLELLTAVTLPAAVGLAVVSPHVANIVLGPNFRSMAALTMPIISAAVIFQIYTYQYLHISFLLSNRNSFYLINTGCAVTVSAVIACVLISQFGPIGAAWARLASEMLGFASAAILTRRAFQIPLTFGRLPVVVLATIAMAGVVKGLDALLDGTDALVLAVVIPAGIVVYSAICLIGNVAHSRDHFPRGFVVLRSIWAS